MKNKIATDWRAVVDDCDQLYHERNEVGLSSCQSASSSRREALIIAPSIYTSTKREKGRVGSHSPYSHFILKFNSHPVCECHVTFRTPAKDCLCKPLLPNTITNPTEKLLLTFCCRTTVIFSSSNCDRQGLVSCGWWISAAGLEEASSRISSGLEMVWVKAEYAEPRLDVLIGRALA